MGIIPRCGWQDGRRLLEKRMDHATGLAGEFDRHLAATLRGDAGAWPFDGSADSGALWKRVQFHGIAGLLAEKLASLSDWPEDLRAHVREEARMQAFWEESHRAMLVSLLDGLAQRGVSTLLMKGSALAYALYAEPSTRRRGDSDLLVAKADLAVTRAVLTELCFTRREDPHGLFFQETWLVDTGIGLVHALDLHWQPSDSPALQKVLPAEEFFALARPLPRLSPHAAMPGLMQTFLQGSLNQAWHSCKGYFVGDERVVAGGRLIWAWDNRLLADAFSNSDWRDLADLAVERGVAPLCLAAVDLALEVGGPVAPNDVRAQLASAQSDTDLVGHIRESNRIRAFFTDFAAIPSLRDKSRFVLGHALPNTRHLHGKYPQSTAWPTPLLHLRRIAEAAWRLARLR